MNIYNNITEFHIELEIFLYVTQNNQIRVFLILMNDIFEISIINIYVKFILCYGIINFL